MNGWMDGWTNVQARLIFECGMGRSVGHEMPDVFVSDPQLYAVTPIVPSGAGSRVKVRSGSWLQSTFFFARKKMCYLASHCTWRAFYMM